MAGVYSHAQESSYRFSLGTQFGFLYGHISELVYSVPDDTKNELLSELIWDVKPLYYFGLHFDLCRRDVMKDSGFFLSLFLKAGIPLESGKMENRDWMSVENAELTHFSAHTNKNNHLFLAEVSVGATLPVKNFFYVKPFLTGCWSYFSFTGKDGYGEYARSKGGGAYYPISDNPNTESFYGQDVIQYNQNWIKISPGISAGLNFLSGFAVDFSLKISMFTYCKARDDHLSVQISNGSNTTPRTYMDFTFGGLFLEPAFNFMFSIKNLDFVFNIAYRQIGNANGFSYISIDNSDYYFSAAKAGAGLKMLDSGFLVRMRF